MDEWMNVAVWWMDLADMVLSLQSWVSPAKPLNARPSPSLVASTPTTGPAPRPPLQEQQEEQQEEEQEEQQEEEQRPPAL